MSFKNGPSDWKVKSTKNVYNNKDFAVYEDTIDLGGKDKTYVRGVRRDYSTIVPFVSDNEILLIKRYRHLTDSMQLEIPLVSVNEGEAPEQAAVKALKDKAGYIAREIAFVGTFTLDYTMLEQKGHIYAAHGLTKAEKRARPEGEERIDVVRMLIKDARKYLLEGKITDASSITALYRALDYNSGQQS